MRTTKELMFVVLFLQVYIRVAALTASNTDDSKKTELSGQTKTGIVYNTLKALISLFLFVWSKWSIEKRVSLLIDTACWHIAVSAFFSGFGSERINSLHLNMKTGYIALSDMFD